MSQFPIDFDAIVLGAGVSGLAAAADLERAGLNVLCLEARPRIGGRILTHREPLSPVPFELGAEFVHGSPPELLAIADAAGLLLCDLGDHDTYLRDGEWHSGAAFDEGDDGVGDLMEQLAHYTGPDQPWAAFAASASASDAVKRNATRYVEGFNAARAEIISVASLRQDHLAAAELDEERQFRVLSGYDQVPLWLAHQLQAPQQTIRLNSIVESVVWERGSVAVSVRGREQPFNARACVITFPVGVLQNSAALFSPAPQQQLTAAANIASGEVYRVVLRFDENFWETIPGVSGASFLLTDEEPFPTWWTSTPIRSSVITAWSAGPHTDKLIGRAPGEVVREATGTLARITKRSHAAVEDQLRSWHFHDWHSDPFSRGAYTYAKAGHLDARAKLAESVEDTLFFAGEATETEGHSATVHGAIATGRRAAREVARALAHRFAKLKAVLTDLIQIKTLGEKKRGENERFRKHLKQRDHSDRILRRIAENVEDQIDCKVCANCCRVATVRLSTRDVENMAKAERISPQRFINDFTIMTEDEGLILKRTKAGCVFLDGNLCLVYDSRPANCQDFPHVVRGAGSILSRMWQFADRAVYCPIVYNSLEAFKEQTGFKR